MTLAGSPATQRVDVIIPTWNRADLLRRCLESLRTQTFIHQVIVVDNASIDGTEEMLSLDFPEVRVVQMSQNRGVGGPVNAGVASGSGDAIVLINNDVVVQPGFLEALVAPLAADPGVGSVAGVLLDAAGAHVDAAGIVVDAGLAAFSHLHGACVTVLEEAVARPRGACGGAAAYRRSAYEAVGGFDEHIFAYSEDVDLALRLGHAGWTCSLAPGARVLHLGSATLGRRSSLQLARATWARGYLLGRYRIGAFWLALETVVALLNAVLAPSRVLPHELWRGWRSGRGLPPRPVPRTYDLSIRESLGRRARSVVGSDRTFPLRRARPARSE